MHLSNWYKPGVAGIRAFFTLMLENLIGKWIKLPDGTEVEIMGIAYRPAHPDYPPVQDEIVVLHRSLTGHKGFITIEDLLVFHRLGKICEY